jgi:hypothetical protein
MNKAILGILFAAVASVAMADKGGHSKSESKYSPAPAPYCAPKTNAPSPSPAPPPAPAPSPNTPSVPRGSVTFSLPAANKWVPPVEQVREDKLAEPPQIVYIPVEKVVEVPVEKIVEVPVEVVVEKIVEVPVYTTVNVCPPEEPKPLIIHKRKPRSCK